MKKLFISADMEGTCGVTHWNEVEKNHPDYVYFSDQMTREVAAACKGAHKAGFADILIKDAHDSGRNLIPRELPEYVRLYRGRGLHPYCMMVGLDQSFDGVVLTGYHAAATLNGNPLSHTINLQNAGIWMNGYLCSELRLNAWTAASLGVPVYAVTGDAALCAEAATLCPNALTVATNSGLGNGSTSIHPDVAVRQIEETVERALAQEKARCMVPLPEHFEVKVRFKEHQKACSGGFYPGAARLDDCTVCFEAAQYFDVLRFLMFVL